MDRVAPMVDAHAFVPVIATQFVTVTRCMMCGATWTTELARSWNGPDVVVTTTFQGVRICPMGFFHQQQRRIN